MGVRVRKQFWKSGVLQGEYEALAMALGEKQEETWKGHNGNVARDGVIHLSPTKAKPASGQSGR